MLQRPCIPQQRLNQHCFHISWSRSNNFGWSRPNNFGWPRSNNFDWPRPNNDWRWKKKYNYRRPSYPYSGRTHNGHEGSTNDGNNNGTARPWDPSTSSYNEWSDKTADDVIIPSGQFHLCDHLQWKHG